MVVARDDEAHRALAAHDQGAARSSATTWRWSRAARASRTGTIDAPLGPRPPARPRSAPSRGRGAREARTHFEVIEPLPADTLVEARLETGRTHQIRAHFAAIGHPVAGDPRYGARRPPRPRAPVPARAAARASRIRSRGEETRVRAPSCRADLSAALERARG